MSKYTTVTKTDTVVYFVLYYSDPKVGDSRVLQRPNPGTKYNSIDLCVFTLSENMFGGIQTGVFIYSILYLAGTSNVKLAVYFRVI